MGLLVAASAGAADPAAVTATVADDNGLLTVSYTLTEKAVVTFDATTNGVPIEAKCFHCAEGDVFKLMPAGAGSFVWRPANDIPGFNVQGADLKVRVKAWSVDAPPDYMVVNLATNAAVKVSVNYYECEAQLPGKITDPVYKTAKLVMRKIPAAEVTWRMGSPTTERGRGSDLSVAEDLHLVTLSEDFYLGVYPVTVAQNSWMTGKGDASTSTVALRTNFNSFRGASGTYKSWPDDEHEINAQSSSLYLYRQYTGIDFDLPTEAQWEFACRAGEKAALYNGEELEATDNSPNLDKIARYGYNSSNNGQYGNGPEVGSRAPNAYGLYDMLGGMWEICLDRWVGNLGSSPVRDPKGASSSTVNRVMRGGAYDWNASGCRAAARIQHAPANGLNMWNKGPFNRIAQDFTGRLWAPAKAVK